MSFKDLKLEKVYKNLSSDVINDFYLPVLRESVIYKRAVGFFNSSALYEIAVGLQSLICNNGKIELIVSPKLEEDDVNAIIKGYKTRDEVIENAIMREFKEPITLFQQKKLNLLANLIADQRLDIKVAFKQDINSIGIFHEKIGIMQDISGNKVAFGGSMNETYSGLLQNYESIDVFCSWLPEDAERVVLKEKDFDCLWNNTHSAMEVLEFPKVAIERLNQYKKDDYETLASFNMDKIEQEDKEQIAKKDLDTFFRIPSKEQGFKGLYDYQNEAIQTWLDNNCRGTYNMATGTGKTLTALGSLSELSKKLHDNLVVVILCPQTHLIEQWVEDIKWFGVEPLICYSSYPKWKEDLKNQVRYFNAGVVKHFCVITTNDSFTLPDMQTNLDKIKGDICLVVDEAHNFGATNQRKYMKDIFKYRLGLSATLERHRDEEGTQALKDFFGKECINYPLSRAIAEDKLCKYFYYPIVVTLEDDELEAYNQISEKISNLMKKFGHDKGKDLPDAVKVLLIKRSRIISGARNKIKALYDLMLKYKKENNILVYCGATKVPNDNYIGDFDYMYDDVDSFDGKSKKQIDIVADMLGNKLSMRMSKFTADEKKKEREQIKRDFAEGNMLQCIVAIKCLDEGLNIPGIQKAFILASSTNPKEYIQRRGRVLRKSPNKQFAEIFDFITLPHELDGYVNPQTANYELSLIKKERERMVDFAQLSENASAVDNILTQIDSLYQLKIIGGYDDEF